MTTPDNEPLKPELPEPSEKSPKTDDPKVFAQITAQITSQVMTQVSKYFSGPLPPPEILIEYNSAFSGAAERVVAMAERQSSHRHSLESKLLTSNLTNETIGLIIGGIIAVMTLAIGGYLIAQDKSPEAFGLIVVNAVTMATIFIYGRHAQALERAKKLKPIEKASTPEPMPPAKP